MSIKKVEHNFYMTIELSYDKKIILPIAEGETLLNILANAEKIDISDYKRHKIAVGNMEIPASIIPLFEYKEMKTNALLNPGEE